MENMEILKSITDKLLLILEFLNEILRRKMFEVSKTWKTRKAVLNINTKRKYYKQYRAIFSTKTAQKIIFHVLEIIRPDYYRTTATLKFNFRLILLFLCSVCLQNQITLHRIHYGQLLYFSWNVICTNLYVHSMLIGFHSELFTYNKKILPRISSFSGSRIFLSEKPSNNDSLWSTFNNWTLCFFVASHNILSNHLFSTFFSSKTRCSMTVTRSTEKIFEDNEGNFANNDLINLSIFFKCFGCCCVTYVGVFIDLRIFVRVC